MSYKANTKDITREGCTLYFENWIGVLKEKMTEEPTQALLWEEQIDFLAKAVEELKK